MKPRPDAAAERQKEMQIGLESGNIRRSGGAGPLTGALRDHDDLTDITA